MKADAQQAEVPGSGPRPLFDPELAAALEGVPEDSRLLRNLDDVEERRAFIAQFALSDEELRGDGSIEVDRRTAPGPPGSPDISLIICRPTKRVGALPAVYHIHGGGMVMGDARTGLGIFAGWARRRPMIVVSVDYRLAPENPDPAPVEDCYAGLVWTVAHAEELGLDPSRVVVAGGSAGGGLSAGTVLVARDRGGPAILGQMLSCPMLDDRNDSVSSHQMAGVGVWDHGSNEAGWRALLGPRWGTSDVSPYAAPARMEDLSGLPPTFVDVGSAETFRDEDVAYASRIWAAGGQAELHVWPGGFHGFEGFAPNSALAQAAVRARFEWLTRLLES